MTAFTVERPIRGALRRIEHRGPPPRLTAELLPSIAPEGRGKKAHPGLPLRVQIGTLAGHPIVTASPDELRAMAATLEEAARWLDPPAAPFIDGQLLLDGVDP